MFQPERTFVFSPSPSWTAEEAEALRHLVASNGASGCSRSRVTAKPWVSGLLDLTISTTPVSLRLVSPVSSCGHPPSKYLAHATLAPISVWLKENTAPVM